MTQFDNTIFFADQIQNHLIMGSYLRSRSVAVTVGIIYLAYTTAVM